MRIDDFEGLSKGDYDKTGFGAVSKSLTLALHLVLKEYMGKGDIKTKKGKITSGTYGVKRPHKKKIVDPPAKAKSSKKKKK